MHNGYLTISMYLCGDFLKSLIKLNIMKDKFRQLI